MAGDGRAGQWDRVSEDGFSVSFHLTSTGADTSKVMSSLSGPGLGLQWLEDLGGWSLLPLPPQDVLGSSWDGSSRQSVYHVLASPGVGGVL